jgi:hypothetical protein
MTGMIHASEYIEVPSAVRFQLAGLWFKDPPSRTASAV